MKKLAITLLSTMMLTICLNAQDCKFYDREHHIGNSWNLEIGESITVHFDDDEEPSWEIFNNNAAIYFEEVNPPGNYPFMRVYSDNSSHFVGGTNQYDDAGDIVIHCINKCEEENCLPQPSTWIPVDGEDAYDPIASLLEGEHVLVLRKAYLWENSEDIGGIHGPYGSVGTRVFDPALFEAYNFNDIVIEQDYDEESGPFKYGTPFSLTAGDLPGPVYFAAESPNPKSEWIDGPWGVCYSNILVFNWDNNPDQEEVYVMLREGDDTNPDDYMGGGLVNKNETGPILIKCWHFGYLILENILVPNGGELNISDSDFYWNHKWNGNHPEQVWGAYDFDQYNPLSGNSIEAMEDSFPANSTIGLLGGEFPIGTLDKPMLYVAPCEPAIFDN